jgi:hypothetical protein
MATENNIQNDDPRADSTKSGNTIKDPKDWSTGAEPMTGAQKSYLNTLSQQSGEQLDENLTKSEASQMIEEKRTAAVNKGEAEGDKPAISNTEKDPETWVTGSEPMTGAQHSYLKTLSDEAGEKIDENLTKGEASKMIEELQQKTGRGVNTKN